MDWNSRFATRTRLMQRSTVRELLKLTTAWPDMISMAGGLPAPELFPVEEIHRATDAVLVRRAPEALQYGPTEGLTELRDWIAADSAMAGVSIGRENVLITSGAQQALDLIGRVFLEEPAVQAIAFPVRIECQIEHVILHQLI